MVQRRTSTLMDLVPLRVTGGDVRGLACAARTAIAALAVGAARTGTRGTTPLDAAG